MSLDPKSPLETYLVSFDFSENLNSVTSAIVSAELDTGSDPQFASVVSGFPTIVGSVVHQRVTGGVHFCDYRLRCTATDGTDTFVLDTILPVRPTTPT